MKMYICGLREIPNYSWRGITHVLSLLDHEFTDVIHRPNQMLPDVVNTAAHFFEGYFTPPARIELQFDDVSGPDPWSKVPTAEDAKAILEFGAALPDDATVLVHCHAGISRSTAAATLILMQKYPEKSIAAILETLAEIRPQAHPNRLILLLGAEILGKVTEMKEAIRRML